MRGWKQKNGAKTVDILGVKVVSTRMDEVLEILRRIVAQKTYDRPFFVVTAYSETFLKAEKNQDFKKALFKADLIVGDGVSTWAAADFVAGPTRGWLRDLWRGLTIGFKVISGKYGGRPEGIKIFKEFLEERNYKRFLLGGFGGVAERLAKKYGGEWGENEDGAVEQINDYKPDILFVALGRFKQEIWIARNLSKLKCKVVMGVGSAFDEIAREGVWQVPVPEWVSKAGLKWLWRVFADPKHIVRALRAFPVFPLKVYWEYERNLDKFGILKR